MEGRADFQGWQGIAGLHGKEDDLVHVTNRTIISIEKEQYSPSLMLSYRIAQVFGTTVEELCCLKENKEREDENL